MIYSDLESVKKNINKNEKLFSDKLMEKKYNYTFANTLARGNLSSFTNIPTIMLNLAPNFNIPAAKIAENDSIINYIIEKTNILPYITYVYKEPITKKVSIEESENNYNSIVNLCKEISFVLDNIYHNYDNILYIHMGKYSEYQYFHNIMNNYSNRYTNRNQYIVYIHHTSYFIKEDNGFNKNSETLLKDIDTINKKIETIKI